MKKQNNPIHRKQTWLPKGKGFYQHFAAKKSAWHHFEYSLRGKDLNIHHFFVCFIVFWLLRIVFVRKMGLGSAFVAHRLIMTVIICFNTYWFYWVFIIGKILWKLKGRFNWVLLTLINIAVNLNASSLVSFSHGKNLSWIPCFKLHFYNFLKLLETLVWSILFFSK